MKFTQNNHNAGDVHNHGPFKTHDGVDLMPGQVLSVGHASRSGVWELQIRFEGECWVIDKKVNGGICTELDGTTTETRSRIKPLIIIPMYDI